MGRSRPSSPPAAGPVEVRRLPVRSAMSFRRASCIVPLCVSGERLPNFARLAVYASALACASWTCVQRVKLWHSEASCISLLDISNV